MLLINYCRRNVPLELVCLVYFSAEAWLKTEIKDGALREGKIPEAWLANTVIDRQIESDVGHLSYLVTC